MFKFSNRSEYGIQALIELALHRGEGPLQARSIARNQRVPARYLEQILNSLKKAGLVDSVRGAQGGYHLAKEPSQIHLLDILEALEGSLPEEGCTAAEAARLCWHQVEGGECVIRQIKHTLMAGLRKQLQSVTLEEVSARRRNRVPMFHI